jgi:hypothetical protein
MARLAWARRSPHLLAWTVVVLLLALLTSPASAIGGGSSTVRPSGSNPEIVRVEHRAVEEAGGTVGWHNLTGANASSPVELGGMVLTPDSSTGGLLLFGGTGPGGPTNATWTYNGSTWTPWSGPGPSPSNRSGAEATWDPSENGVLLYGGIDATGNPDLHDTWLFRGGSWENISADVVGDPGPRGGGSLAIDPVTGAAVLFGGADGPGRLTSSTWTFWNGTWSNLTSTAGTPPGGRVFPAMASDPSANGVVLYGGQNYGASNDNDTWLFRNGSWHQLAPRENPGTLRGEYLADDSTYGAEVLFGGDTSQSGTPVNSTWVLSPSGNWTDVTSSVGNAPSPRWTGGMADDPTLGGVVLFGGCEALGCAMATSQTWTLTIPPLEVSLTSPDASPSRGEAVALVADASGGFAPRNYSFSAGDGFVVRTSASTVNVSYSACGSFAATVAVSDAGGVSVVSNRLAVTAGPTGAAWCSLTGPVGPAARGGVALAYDPLLGADVLFGGTPATGGAEGDTWLRTASGWTETADTGPSARADASAWYDPGEGGVVLFGGQSNSGTVLGDTWLFTGEWNNITSEVGPAPSPRFQAAVAYDSATHAAVLFGGQDAGGGLLNDTWLFSNGMWTNVTSSAGTAPSPRIWASIADDPAGGGVVLFGGEYCAGVLLCGDTWRFAADGWRQVVTSGTSPSARRGAPFAYDAEYGADLLFGGAVPSTGASGQVGADDVWAFVGSNWTNVSSLLGPVPPGRWASGIADDPTVGGLVVFGGCTALGCTEALNDTWSLAIPALVLHLSESTSATTAPANTSLNATASGGAGNLSYSWVFGDGHSELRSSAAELTHEYSSGGNYAGRLTVTDAAGVSTSVTWAVNLSAPSQNRTNGTTPIPHAKPVGSGGTPSWVTWAVLGVLVAAAVGIVAVGLWQWRRRPAGAPTGRGAGGLGGDAPAAPIPVTGVLSTTAAAGAAGPASAAGSGPPNGASGSESAPIAAPPGAVERPGESGSLGARILIHLHRQGRLGPEELASLSVTQAGLSDALGRPQSAFARTLQRLESSGLVFTELRHVKGASRRLKVYRLTPLGEERAAELRSRGASSPESQPRG